MQTIKHIAVASSTSPLAVKFIKEPTTTAQRAKWNTTAKDPRPTLQRNLHKSDAHVRPPRQPLFLISDEESDFVTEVKTKKTKTEAPPPKKARETSKPVPVGFSAKTFVAGKTGIAGSSGRILAIGALYSEAEKEAERDAAKKAAAALPIAVGLSAKTFMAGKNAGAGCSGRILALGETSTDGLEERVALAATSTAGPVVFATIPRPTPPVAKPTPAAPKPTPAVTKPKVAVPSSNTTVSQVQPTQQEKPSNKRKTVHDAVESETIAVSLNRFTISPKAADTQSMSSQGATIDDEMAGLEGVDFTKLLDRESYEDVWGTQQQPPPASAAITKHTEHDDDTPPPPQQRDYRHSETSLGKRRDDTPQSSASLPIAPYSDDPPTRPQVQTMRTTARRQINPEEESSDEEGEQCCVTVVAMTANLQRRGNRSSSKPRFQFESRKHIDCYLRISAQKEGKDVRGSELPDTQPGFQSEQLSS